MEQIPCILQSKKVVKIEVIGENLFLLDFDSLVNRRYALDEGPWTFFKELVIFKAPTGFQQAAKMVFDELPIWVHYHNLPLAYMHALILKNVGARLVKVLQIETNEGGSCAGKYARIRVMLDLSKHLRQGIWVKQENLIDEICIILLYGRLPQFCYLCGCLGHVLSQMMIRMTASLVLGSKPLRAEEIEKLSMLTTKALIVVDLIVNLQMGLVRVQLMVWF